MLWRVYIFSKVNEKVRISKRNLSHQEIVIRKSHFQYYKPNCYFIESVKREDK